MTDTVERCCLPALTRFTGWHCTGSGPRCGPPPLGSQCTSPQAPLQCCIISNRGHTAPVYSQCERCRAHRAGPERRSCGLRRPRRAVPARRVPSGARRAALARGRRGGDPGRHGLRLPEAGQFPRRIQLQDVAAHHHVEPRDGPEAEGRRLVPPVRDATTATKGSSCRPGSRRTKRRSSPRNRDAKCVGCWPRCPRSTGRRCCCRRPATTRSTRSAGCSASRPERRSGGRWRAGGS